MSALFVTSDLLFSSQVQAAARQAGVPLEVLRSPSELPGCLDSGNARLLILDLSTAGCDPADLLPQIGQRPEGPYVVAYATHLMKSKLQAARAAGCDQVLTRGQFHAQMDDILQPFAD